MKTNYENKVDFSDAVADLHVTLLQAKAVATAFSVLFTEGTEEINILAVTAQPNVYTDLFSTLFSLIHSACCQAEEIDT